MFIRLHFFQMRYQNTEVVLNLEGLQLLRGLSYTVMVINNTARKCVTFWSIERLQQKLQDAVTLRRSLVVHIISSTASLTHLQRAAPSLVEPSHAG
uniref:Uncharacterized protein n=1 Tax=Arundo donax TaxID=35708 RepID=A0A0A9DLT3_ARUDO